MALFPTTPPGILALLIIVVGLAAAIWRRFPMAYTMGLLSIGVYLVELLGPSLFGLCALPTPARTIRADCVILELSFIAPLVAQGQHILTPFTYMFVHADLLHIAGNMFILLTAGPALEERIGSRNFLVIYLLAGFGAAGATVGLWQIGFFEGGAEFSPNVGASGAIFGVLTAFAVLYPREKLPMILPMMFFVLWLPSFAVLMLHLLLNLVYIFSSSNIAWWGHFGGFMVGLAMVPILPRFMPARVAKEGLQVDVEALRPLATTNVQRRALEELEKLAVPKTHDDRVLAEAWWDKFLARAECPTCGKGLTMEGKELTCPDGHHRVEALKK